MSDTQTTRRLNLLFMHHSCGGQWLAEPGPDQGSDCIYETHPNGGGLKSRLEKNFSSVHEASYHSRIGQNTDIFDWLPKFRDHMEEIITCERQDRKLSGNERNQIVVFKSCFPNNAFQSEGEPPGNPAGPDLTVWNAKATYLTLLEIFKNYPQILFVCVTAPPLAPKRPQPVWKTILKKALGRDTNPEVSATLARQFNNWLSGKEGWLKNYALKNVAVFDYYHILTGNGKSNLLIYPSGDGHDSHPNREGNQKAAEAFILFLNSAVLQAGLSR